MAGKRQKSLFEFGFSGDREQGADLQHLVNSAALHAVKRGSNEVTMEDLEHARDVILMGPAKLNKLNDVKCRWNTAYHEAGHTVVAYFTKDADPLHKVTIRPRGQALGFTAFLPETDTYSSTKSELVAKLDVSMGGRVGEEIIYGPDEVTTGAADDFRVANKLASSMVTQFGMSEKVGLRDFSSSTSEEMQTIIDGEISKILQESYTRAKDLLTKYAKQHKLLAEALMKYETLDFEDIKKIMDGKNIKLK